jgi:hypothetical protein
LRCGGFRAANAEASGGHSFGNLGFEFACRLVRAKDATGLFSEFGWCGRISKDHLV